MNKGNRLRLGLQAILGNTLYPDHPERKKPKKAGKRKQWYTPDSPEVKRMSKGK